MSSTKDQVLYGARLGFINAGIPPEEIDNPNVRKGYADGEALFKEYKNSLLIPSYLMPGETLADQPKKG